MIVLNPSLSQLAASQVSAAFLQRSTVFLQLRSVSAALCSSAAFLQHSAALQRFCSSLQQHSAPLQQPALPPIVFDFAGKPLIVLRLFNLGVIRFNWILIGFINWVNGLIIGLINGFDLD
jgi:hypothetical protein